MTDFSALKKNRSSSLEQLSKKIEKLSGTKPAGDDRYWNPTVDDAKNGYAVIRFLPAPPADGEEADPFVRLFSHSFKGPEGKWYIENSLTTLGKPDPVSEYNTKLWNTGIEANQEQVRKQKRKLHYIANIYVVKDAGNPANNGKVFLFKFGKKIFDKITDAMNPKFEDETPLNPFDLWEGANFKLKIADKDGYRNYDKSEFEKSAPLSKNDDELETIWNSEYSLKAEVAEDKFKSYSELKTRFDTVLGLNKSFLDEDEAIEPAAKPAVKAKEAPTSSWDADVPFDVDEDEDLKFFNDLTK